MSNEAITWAYRQDITSGAKFVLVALADMADEAHSCFPGQAKLAAMTGQSTRSVRRQLAELELAGHIRRARRFDALGHRTSDRYTLPVNTDVLIPTGQDDHRSRTPLANVTSGQQRSPLADIHDTPTGHGGQVTQREPKEDPSVTPRPPANAGRGQRRRGHCPRHVRYLASCAACERLEHPPAEKPRWCGECDERTRLADYDSETPHRCPNCHPVVASSRSEGATG